MSAIVAWVAESALGIGRPALGIDDRRTAIAPDPVLAAAGLRRPHAARAALATSGDRATVLLERALAAIAIELDRVRPSWRRERVGLVVGTSSGGMETFEGRGGIEGTYLGPVLAVARPMAFEPFALVLGACASATIALGVARAWLDQDRCDVVIAGGFDGVTVFVASGFEGLRAVCTEVPRPFRTNRDGLALGEGAALVAMVRESDDARAWISGFGASCDAVHITAPDRSGEGLARAAEAALRDAGDPAIGLVSAHGTATEYNDAAEEKAIARVASGVPVHALKGAIGHTLGAAGALEAIAACEAMREGIAPASAGDGPILEGVRVLDVAQAIDARHALKLSAAFGGANAALVLSLAPARPRPARRVFVSRAVHVEAAWSAATLAARTSYPEDRILRADALVTLAMSAVAALGEELDQTAGIVMGHGLATHQTNTAYLARIRAAGAHLAEPRRFPYTSPNAAAGECAVAFGLRGPSFAVGGGPHGGLEALMIAKDLVATHRADRLVVVAVDEGGEAGIAIAPETRRGAVALVVGARQDDEDAPGMPVRSDRMAAELGACTVHLDATSRLFFPAFMDAHRALLPLANEAARPSHLESALPWGGFANARLFWL